jgi:hypothetical protein
VQAGAKIKEIRDATSALIDMQKDLLPGSTERACLVSGTTVAVAQSIFHIACTMIQVPSRGSNVQYNPAAVGGGGAPAMGGYGAPPPAYGSYGGAGPQRGYGAPGAAPGAYGAPGGGYGGGYGGGGGGGGGAGAYTAAAGPIPGGYGAGGYGVSAPRAQGAAAGGATQQLSVPNDIAGAIIGRGGAKINEIRQMSQAQVSTIPCIPLFYYSICLVLSLCLGSSVLPASLLF